MEDAGGLPGGRQMCLGALPAMAMRMPDQGATRMEGAGGLPGARRICSGVLPAMPVRRPFNWMTQALGFEYECRGCAGRAPDLLGRLAGDVAVRMPFSG